MSEGLRMNPSTCHPLNAVVGNRRSGVQRRLDITLLQQIPLSGRMSPHTCQTVGLQFHPDRQIVGALGARLLHLPHLPIDVQEMLNMMSDFVREHVRLRELAGRAEAGAQLIVESEIDVDLLIARAVERASRRLSKAARRIDGITEEHELGMTVTAGQ